jgi:hypothetical protein
MGGWRENSTYDNRRYRKILNVKVSSKCNNYTIESVIYILVCLQNKAVNE